MEMREGQCPVCRAKNSVFDAGKVGIRFAWLLDQLEARLPEAHISLSAQPPEILLLNALDERLSKTPNYK